MLQHFESLDMKTPEEEADGVSPNTKICLRQKVVEAAKRIVYTLQDVIVSSKYLPNGLGDFEEVVSRRPRKSGVTVTEHRASVF
jgi:hypothetical protein